MLIPLCVYVCVRVYVYVQVFIPSYEKASNIFFFEACLILKYWFDGNI